VSEQLIKLGESFLRCLDVLEDKTPGAMLSVPKIEALLHSNGIILPDDVSVTEFLDQLLRWGWIGTDNNGFDLVEQSFGIAAKGQIRSASSVDYAEKFTQMVNDLPLAPDAQIEYKSEVASNVHDGLHGHSSSSLNPPAVDSSRWTGLATVRVDKRNAKAISRLIDLALSELIHYSNEGKAQARTLLLAAKDLTDAPEPPSDIIWALIERAGAVVGLLDIFFRIFSEAIV
jgi:hypothetical protein